MVDVGGVGSLWDEDGGLRMRWGVRQATVAAEGCAWGGQAGHSQQQKAVQRRVILASGTPGCSLPVLPHTGARADP